MAIQYSTLTADKTVDGSIKNWINYSLVPSATVLTMAEAWIYERVRTRDMITETAISVTAAASELSMPTRFLDPIEIRLDGDGRALDFVHENLLNRFYDEDGELMSGQITRYAAIGSVLKFDVASEKARTGRIWFYQTPVALSGDNETNWLTSRYPALLIMACNAFANHHRKFYAERDKELVLVEKMIKDVNIAADMGRRGQYIG